MADTKNTLGHALLQAFRLEDQRVKRLSLDIEAGDVPLLTVTVYPRDVSAQQIEAIATEYEIISRSELRDIRERLAAVQQAEPVAVHQWRFLTQDDGLPCLPWHDGHPDQYERLYEYETRTLYTAPQPHLAQQAEPVAAQHRFRHPQKSRPDWSPWQLCQVRKRPAWEIDSQGYEVEYRNLYTAPPPQQQAEPGQSVAWVDERAISWLAGRRNKASAHVTTTLSAAKSLERPMALYTAPQQQAEPVQGPVAFDTAHAMRLADEYADLAADVRAAQGYPEHALAQDRKRMDEARASLAAYLSRQAEPVPMPPFLPVSQWNRGCAVCGAHGNATGYVCPRSDCPTKVTCGGVA